MFDNLSDRLESVFKRLKGYGRLSEDNIQEGLREVRLALLEADVNFRVVKDFVARVRERAVGREVMESLTPAQQVVKIVHDELVALLGGRNRQLDLSGRQPAVLLLVGLQGSGKTTTAAKLARWLLSKGRAPYLVPADVYRPAAVEQLRVLGERIGVPVHPTDTSRPPVETAREAVARAGLQGLDTVIVDTAGRLHVDEALMGELRDLKARLEPQEILLVADAMTGQDAVNIAGKFDADLSLTGVILTKVEGDARGGAALSIQAVTGTPIKFVGVGEKLDQLEPFHPERIADRILGMGDVLTLIEKAQATMDRRRAQELQEKLRKDAFTLEDFRDQLRQLRRMGSLEQVLSMIPGLGAQLKKAKGLMPDERELVRVEAIIDSMTPAERRNYRVINGSRRRRIARGSGTTVQDVNRLLKNYAQMAKMFKKMRKGGFRNLPQGMLPW
ncbi:signal recognition particle protein [Dissulfurirhabdus thermomarina]|uniref:Signal recognition particle protein n=1 Tax=Dissulfurirhabdus thermomarina TaxID=1765737 RepID=A0A6N9TJL2_DISTH|nr:signal recognition particle protein [Dissulfurirhabdus thermomarina]NDY41452.1 signal recognition particle protein [Dissulfurirhabdus thermomarina]NMX24266.1 signal recognition particle protein [Dissulfurirhabdus thermomarina]